MAPLGRADKEDFAVILNSFDSTQVPMSGSAMNSGRGHTMYTLYAQNLCLVELKMNFQQRGHVEEEKFVQSEEDASRRRGCVVHS